MNKKNQLIIIFIVLFSAACCVLYFTGLPGPSPGTPTNETVHNHNLTHLKRITSLVVINATVADASLTSMPLCHGKFTENSSLDIENGSLGDIRWNLPSEEDVPEVAEHVMEQYGGIPPDATSNGASTHYSREYNLSRNEYVSKKPMYTTISYSQGDVNGFWILVDSNYLDLALGDNGDPLRIHKEWRNYTCSGSVPIIPLDTAIGKFGSKEFLDSEWHPEFETGELTIDIISPAYYAKKLPDNDTILEPIWMFVGGNATTGARLGFNVYARKFADFTISPANGRAPLAVKFLDSSETNPEQWSWDFGDSTKSMLQNPTHTYYRPGNYTVTLTAWNDLGSDTISKSVTVTG